MSDVQVQADWWQATDGRWYPPERHPNYRPTGILSADTSSNPEQGNMSPFPSQAEAPPGPGQRGIPPLPNQGSVPPFRDSASVARINDPTLQTHQADIPDGRAATTVSDVQVRPDWWRATDGRWYSPERHPNFRPSFDLPVVAPGPLSDFAPLTRQEARAVSRTSATQELNALYTVTYRGGWIGLFAGENQIKALQRSLSEINSLELCVVAAVEDRWSVWKRIGVVLLLIVTLGFVGKVPNVLLITEPIA